MSQHLGCIWRGFSLLLLLCVLCVSSDVVPTKIGFGSCAKQRLDQHFWPTISSQNLDAFFWLGDTIYPDCDFPDCILAGYSVLANASHPYAKFRSTQKLIDGTWDDHDYGVNDGDGSFVHKDISQQLFLDFLNIPKLHPRRLQKGVYTSRVIPLKDALGGSSIKVIILDTRYHRSAASLYNVGKYRVPMAGNIAAALRFLASLPGYGWDHPGDLLGDEQWRWLQSELTSDPEVVAHVIISSIQVMSANPFFEGWGQFPQSRRRLFEVVQQTKPRGLVFLSGDVHLGEILGDESCVLEFTSSGLTHSLLEHSFLGALLSDAIIPFYGYNFTVPNRRPTKSRVYVGNNFGTLTFRPSIDSEGLQTVEMQGIIYDIEARPKLKGRTVIKLDLNANDYTCLEKVPHVLKEKRGLEFVLYTALLLTYILIALVTAYGLVILHLMALRRVYRIKSGKASSEAVSQSRRRPTTPPSNSPGRRSPRIQALQAAAAANGSGQKKVQ